MSEIVIIGGGEDKAAIAASLAKSGHEDIIVMTPDEAKQLKQLPFPKSETFIIHNPYPIETLTGDKPFICKGKHRYIESAGQWVCQCGRNMND